MYAVKVMGSMHAGSEAGIAQSNGDQPRIGKADTGTGTYCIKVVNSNNPSGKMCNAFAIGFERRWKMLFKG